MKKIYTFILGIFTVFLFAQNPDLFNYSWTITQMGWNGTSYPNPSGVSFTPSASTFNQNNPNFCYYFNAASFWTTYSTTSNSFEKSVNGGCTIVDYWGPNYQEANQYDMWNCEFYVLSPIGRVFNYSISTVGTTKVLIVTDTVTNNKIYYNGSILGSKELNKQNHFKIYPNPVSDNLIVESKNEINSIEIFSVEGKLIIKLDDFRNKDAKIDIRNLIPGAYFLVLNNNETTKFIKE